MLHRAALGVVVLFGLAVATFLIIHLVPADPVRQALGGRASPAQIEALRGQLGLDRPLPTQFWNYLSDSVTGRFGTSFLQSAPVGELVGQRVAPSAVLIGYGLLVALVTGVPLAIVAALRPNGVVDHGVRLIATLSFGMPLFWLGLILALVFGLELHVFPVSGYEGGLGGILRTLTLPALTLGLALAVIVVRTLRSSLLEVLRTDHIDAARARGLSERRIVAKHAMRNAVMPTITIQRRSRPATPVLVGAAIVGLLGLAALLAPLIAPYAPDHVDFLHPLESPSFAHPMGTDDAGRDVLSRSLFGLRLDLAVVLLVTYVPLPIGVLLGATAGYFGRGVDATMARVADVMLAFPFFVLVIGIIAIVGPGLKGVLIGVPLAGWALYFRLARSEMLVLREQPFMLATTGLGYSRPRAILRHAVPNLMRTALIYSTLDMVVNLLLLASLSYLGLGKQPPGAELGTIIAGGQPYLLSAWWIATLPGLVLVAFGVGVGLIGDGLSDGRLRSATA